MTIIVVIKTLVVFGLEQIIVITPTLKARAYNNSVVIINFLETK